MQHYGIIGQPLTHSWSQQYWTTFFHQQGIEADFTPYELSSLHEWYTQTRPHLAWDGYTVTIPFKQQIIPFLTQLDPIAKTIGAVNVVKGTTGYNTDWMGFRDAIAPLIGSRTRALVLGTGGVAKAVKYALETMNIAVTMVSRTHGLRYEQLTDAMIQEHPIIVNCTPLGMWPHTDECPNIPYQALSAAHLLFDCIYNPEQTLFLRLGDQQGAQTINGKQMLINQAQAAWQIWKQ